MRNKHVGLLIISVVLVIGLIIFLFNRALDKIVLESCTHGSSCTMWSTLSIQTWISIILMFFVILIGLYIFFFAKDNTYKSKKINKKDYTFILSDLSKDEKEIYEKIIDSQGTIYQSKLVDTLHQSKVKITRILDKLEGKDLIERKRRGMTNIVILKHKHI